MIWNSQWLWIFNLSKLYRKLLQIKYKVDKEKYRNTFTQIHIKHTWKNKQKPIVWISSLFFWIHVDFSTILWFVWFFMGFSPRIFLIALERKRKWQEGKLSMEITTNKQNSEWRLNGAKMFRMLDKYCSTHNFTP